MNLWPAPDETVLGVSADLRARRKTCVEVLERCLTKIDELEPQVRAWVVIDRDGGRRRALELDADLCAGRWLGPLHGIPIGVKDIVDVAGMPTACGWPRWANRLAQRDATIVRRLREAGAVIVGKTVSTQLASFDPPVTRNPWDLERTPGGSSSGSAAAVACGMCLAAIGSQTGGSITRPASFCGVAGCKPAHRRVSAQGIMPLAPSMDHPGPIARTVRDLAIVLDVIAGPDPLDPDCLATPAPDVCAALQDQRRSAPRLARLRGLFDQKADAAVRAALDHALQQLAGAGARISEPLLPASFDDVLRSHRVIMAAEAAGCHEPVFREHRAELLPKIRELIEEGLATPAPEYFRCRQHQGRLSREMISLFDGADALVTPATTNPAPDNSTTGDPAFNSPWSYTGLPTVSFPIGLSPDALPVGIQLMGHTEPELFRVAAWCEAVIRRA
jgi:aspartyl-tRNA(Asn)/glutamyl-tRNA(Gln) amidotransferase subunit A